jgi:uncharacterized protein
MPLVIYVVAGTLFGVVLTKGELISWFRIQEMFRFQGFHMYGVFMTAIPTAIITVQALKRLRIRALGGEPIALAPKAMGTGARYVFGGTTFGLGWALTGACPGPLFALVGGGVTVMAAAILSALAGTWLYGRVRHMLPH